MLDFYVRLAIPSLLIGGGIGVAVWALFGFLPTVPQDPSRKLLQVVGLLLIGGALVSLGWILLELVPGFG